MQEANFHRLQIKHISCCRSNHLHIFTLSPHHLCIISVSPLNHLHIIYKSSPHHLRITWASVCSSEDPCQLYAMVQTLCQLIRNPVRYTDFMFNGLKPAPLYSGLKAPAWNLMSLAEKPTTVHIVENYWGGKELNLSQVHMDAIWRQKTNTKTTLDIFSLLILAYFRSISLLCIV